MSKGEQATLTALEDLRKRLLDLTTKNRLISYKHPKKSCLRIIDELPDQLVETLLSEMEMRFLPVAEPTREELIAAGYIRLDEQTGQEIRIKKDPSAEEWAARQGLSTDYEVPRPSGDGRLAKHSDRNIQTLLYPHELEARLRRLQQDSQTAIQEMGANILYLAFGFLEWREHASDDRRLAPLYLMPASLRKGRLNPEINCYEYTLSYSGEDIVPNISLQEKLRLDFGMALPGWEEETTPEAYFVEVERLIELNQPSWRVRRYITLALLNFGKLLMYLDLDPERWPEENSIVRHPVVVRFLGENGTGEDDSPDSDGDPGFREEHPIDEIEEIHATYPIIEDADSSQHSALIDAVDGRNLVIEGPPGTGKSQTITNLIAATMAQGKRVLFVAEKLAALEVVRRRLDGAGLGEFCLELHSHKSQKRRVLDEIQQRLERHGWCRKPKEIDAEIARYEDLKSELKGHVDRVNSVWKNTGRPIHSILSAATRYRQEIGMNPESLHPAGLSGDSFNDTDHQGMIDLVKRYRDVHHSLAEQLDDGGVIQDHPWYGVQNVSLQMFDYDRIQEALERWQESLLGLSELRASVCKALGCTSEASPDSLAGLNSLLDELNKIPPLEGDELLDRLPALKGKARKRAQRYLELFKDIQTRFASLAAEVETEVLQDLSGVEALLSHSMRLESLVGTKTQISTLTRVVEELTALRDQVAELVAPVDAVREAVGEETRAHLQLTPKGLAELSTFLRLAGGLPPLCWRHRSPLFDNDELDEVLPGLRREVLPLVEKREELRKSFDLEALPDADELRELTQRLDAGGFFRWCKSDWRGARKQLLGFAARRGVGFSVLYGQLDELNAFVRQRRDVEANQQYKDLLAEHMDGLDTDVATLETLRGWYRDVRREYGTGFTKRASLATALFSLSPEVAQSIRSWCDRGGRDEVRATQDSLEELAKTLTSQSGLREPAAVLAGENGVIGRILSVLDGALRACCPAVRKDDLSTKELAQLMEQLASLREAVLEWEEMNCDNKLLEGRLGLIPGVEKNNTQALGALESTLALAAAVDHEITDRQVKDRVYSEPTAEVFQELDELVDVLRGSLNAQEDCFGAFAQLVDLRKDQWMASSGDQVDALLRRNDAALTRMKALKSWLDYIRCQKQLEETGLRGLHEAVEQGDLDVEVIEEAYLAGVFDRLAREVLEAHPKLERFSSSVHHSLRDRFLECDSQLKLLQRERIAWRINQRPIPSGRRGVRVGGHTERHLLEHECGKKRRHLPIRQLLRRASDALVTLKPCFMMGPMSVAQYLAPGQIHFDVVVMDEASQIRPQDALGAVARGGQLVVVGDPKQLPPTNFFDKMADGDEDDDGALAIEESESILDAALPVFRKRRLRWHYRSRHESLIAFSNQSFYGNDLVLFPSPERGDGADQNGGVTYRRVGRGCFVNGRNTEEAKVVAEAVREHLGRSPDETLGVAAMNLKQRQQIEEEIEILAKRDEIFNRMLETNAQKPEPLFVKNLENVQGDERDVILISMTYGPPEPHAHVFQRFGPINTDLGWRRLNVLFTRARKRMSVFSSMGSEDVQIGATSKKGAVALRGFLRYCETGHLQETEKETDRPPDSDFEIAVADALRASGYQCVPQVGAAGFYIDVAIVDPGNQGRYLMGIECDGATYHSAKSVRDRDRLRQEILEGLGWRIRRIWSTDWFRDPESVLQRLLAELDALKTPVSVPTQEVEGTVPVDAIDDESLNRPSDGETLFSLKADLRGRLAEFDEKVIRVAHPETPESERLLRTAMLDTLVAAKPVSKTEFFEVVPLYLRLSTDPEELDYLDEVLAIINASMGEA